MEPKHDPSAFRSAMGLFGVAAGLAVWALTEFVLGFLGQPRLELGLTAAAVAYFVPALLLSGPMPMPRAMLWAFLPGLVAPALLVWASMRFSSLDEMARTPMPFLAFAVLVLMSLPYLVAFQRREGLSYAVLFNEAWRIVIRAVATGLFLGVFWGVYMVSNLLLSLVGVSFLDDLLDRGAMVWGLSGLVTGLALSVLYEQRAYLSPLLLMRLLQLLLIPVTAVVVVFVARVPFQGLEGAFSGLSVAATLMAMTLALASLISAALDCEAGERPAGKTVLISVQVASLLMPVLAGIAAYAIWQRVDQLGWTPARVAAALICVVTLAYALSYAVGVALRGAWDSRLRRANTLIGLGILALCALSLTPVLNAERISAEDQLARYADGRSKAGNLPLYEMGSRWGDAGREALFQLEETADPRIARLLEDQRVLNVIGPTLAEPIDEQRESLRRLMVLRPEGATWPEGLIEDLPDEVLTTWLEACRQGVDRCVAVISDVSEGHPGTEAYVLTRTPFGTLEGVLVMRAPRGDLAIWPLLERSGPGNGQILRDVLEGNYALVPPTLPELQVGESRWIAFPG